MKQIFLLITLIYFISSIDNETEAKMGPALNAEDRGNYASCEDYNVLNVNGTWLDDSDTDFVPSGVSDCVDLYLWSSRKQKYFDKCCYVRFQLEGKMHAGCVGLSQENYIDTTETIRRMEQGDRTIWTGYADGSKIYQLDCSSFYFKFITFATIFFVALLF